MLWKHSLKVSVISCCFSLFRKWRQPWKMSSRHIYVETRLFTKVPQCPWTWMAIQDNATHSKVWKHFLMTCCPGELSWWLCFTRDGPSTGLCHACGFHLMQCARCSCFAVKRHWLSSPLAFFRTSPCLYNDPSAQHMCLLWKLVGKICSSFPAQ